ncbi:MAG: hypothetical protein ABSG13_22190 [Bryobacteraceae bacterium]
MRISTDEVCAMARRWERKNVPVYWVLLGLTALSVAAYLRGLIKLLMNSPAPWLIAGNVWMLALCCYVGWTLRRGPLKMAPAGPCLEFLRRGYEVQRRTLLGVRWGVVLFAPAIVALWWGGAPVLAAKNLGVQSARVLRLLAGPTPLIVMAVVLSFIWFAFWKEAQKVDREIERLDRE